MVPVAGTPVVALAQMAETTADHPILVVQHQKMRMVSVERFNQLKGPLPPLRGRNELALAYFPRQPELARVVSPSACSRIG